jgi:hypothetical protein
VKRRHRRSGHRLEDQRGNDAEGAASGTAERPRQVRLAILVTLDDAAVGEDDLRPSKVIASQPALATENTNPGLRA